MTRNAAPTFSRIGVPVLVVVTTCAACGVSIDFESGEAVGPMVEETVNIDEFTELEIDSAFDVEFALGQDPSLTVEISESLADDLKVTQEGERLKIDVDHRNISGSHVLKATLSNPDIDTVEVDGAVRLNMADIDTDRLRIALGGASRVEGSGRIDDLVITTDGAARIDFDRVSLGTVEVDADGASNISINQAKQVEGELDGAARLGVGDDTVVRVDTSGAAAVDQ